MGFCSNCGAPVDDNAKFCAKCGFRIGSDIPPQVQSVNYNPNVNSQPAQKPKSSAGRIIGKIFLAIGIVIVAIVAFIFVFSLANADEYIKKANKTVAIEKDDDELAILCAKTSASNEYDVKEKDIDWKDVDVIVADRDGDNLVYLDLKFHDDKDHLKHRKVFVYITDIEKDDDGDYEWRAKVIEWDDNECDYDEKVEQLKDIYEIED